MLSLINDLTGKSQLEAEKARLEAFLSAVPGDYCGWAKDGSVAYSEGFCKHLGLERIENIDDIQTAVSSSDSTRLEGLLNRLEQDGIAFKVEVKDKEDKRTLRLSGTRGQDLSGEDSFVILWLEDVTKTLATQSNIESQIAKNQKRLIQMRTSLDKFPWPLWMRTRNHRISWCNEAYSKFVNASVDDIVKEQKEITPASRKKKKSEEGILNPGPELAAKAMEENSAQETRIHVIQDGKRLLMRIYESPVEEHYTVGFAEDITVQEELESDLKRYRATNEELLEQLRTSIAIYGTETKLEFYNSAFSQLWGLEEQWLNTKPKLGDIMEKLRESRRLPEQADFRRFKQSWMDMFTSLIEPHEDMLYLPDGSALRMLIVPHSGGGLMMTFEDVTSRLELESSYNTLIAVQKETLDNLDEAVAVYGGDGRLKLCNPAFGRLWNINPENLEGEPHIISLIDRMKPFFNEDEWDQRREELIAKGLDRIMHEGRIQLNNGSHIDYVSVPLPDGGVLITYIDVTDTVRVENALREKNAALEAAEQLKLDFLANVSYQLRTPLNAIMGFNDILQQEYFGPLNKRQKDYTHDIGSASERLVNLINDILDLSTIEAGYMMLEKKSVKVYDMVHSLADLVGEWARKEKIKFEIKCAKNIGQIKIDERRLKQAIVNLIRNSISFTPSGGTITLQAKRKKDGVEIEVSDTGVGISRENQIRVFQPFEKAHQGKIETTPQDDIRERQAGAGLGLSLVKHIASMHGGDIELLSEPGKGTSVKIFLPFEGEVKFEPVKMKQSLSLKGGDEKEKAAS